jgi:hypothetical protein
MIVALVEFLSIFLLGLASGVSFSHLLQSGPKKALPAPQFLAIQQILLRNYGPTIGGLEVAALFSTAAMAPLARSCERCFHVRFPESSIFTGCETDT